MKPATFFFLVLSVALLSRAEESAFDLSPFQFQRELESPSSIEGIGVVRADAHLFRHASEKFADVRLIKVSEQGALEWPYLVERDRAGPVR